MRYGQADNWLIPGTILHNRYVVGKCLLHGAGYKNTYLAWDHVQEIKVVINEYFPVDFCARFPQKSELIHICIREFQDGMKWFLDGVRTIYQFRNEPGILTVWDFFEENKTAYAVSEYLGNAVMLNEFIKNKERMTGEGAAALLKPVMNALKAMHSAGYIHRDITPNNISVSSDGAAKLINFSILMKYRSDRQSPSIVLSPGYAPVELYCSSNKGQLGPWTDVYSLGATMYRIVTGIKPEEAIQRKMCDRLLPPNKRKPILTEGFSDAIMKALAVDKKRRFKTVEEFEKALEKGNIKDARRKKKERNNEKMFGLYGNIR
ncbi:MAG: serine/threonine protein kinase [Butyrivibrio sp.]|nr:serine/threonine protein kinase [Butyrivibrio sp.]